MSTLAEAFNHPFVANNSTPLFTNLFIIFSLLFGGGGLTFYLSQILGDKPPSEGIDPPPIAYTEQHIKVDSVCKTKDFLNKGRVELGASENADVIVTAKLSPSTELWPVFRWKCNFKTKLNNETGEFLKVKEVSLGINLHEYCKLQYSDKWYASHKHYEDPDSLYCTVVHYEGDDEDNSLNNNVGN